MTTTGPCRIVPAGESTVIVQFENRIDPAINERAIGLAAALATTPVAGVRDVVPTYRTVAVCFDPLKTDVGRLVRRIEAEVGRLAEVPDRQSAPIRVPVCYGGAFGPDLAEVARFAGTGPDDVIATHAATTYRVFMLGFLPGFAYMGTVPDRIAAPRRINPRVRVPRGSVAIAGRQTGIYPSDGPGGWQLIGRTPLVPFDLHRTPAFLFKAGDAVQFVPVNEAEYEFLIQNS